MASDAIPARREVDGIRVDQSAISRSSFGEPNGQLAYCYCYDDNDPDTIVVFQLGADQASGQDFVKQPWFADYERETAALLAGPSEFRSATPQWVKGAAA
ncbi:MAG: hypothetical protein EPO23_08220 [Xanthobacteraceae bacterium]|nr:MAG: hypothetical protein EPO23_08220 [Xanthobacteraceae bacterium]